MSVRVLVTVWCDGANDTACPKSARAQGTIALREGNPTSELVGCDLRLEEGWRRRGALQCCPVCARVDDYFKPRPRPLPYRETH